MNMRVRLHRLAARTALVASYLAVAPAALGQDPAPLQPPQYEEPEDNAFDDYLRATQLLTDDLSAQVADAYAVGRDIPPDAEPILAACRQVLAALREGLPKVCLMPGDLTFDTPLPYLAGFRGLARLLCLEGRHYEWQGQWAKALGSYLDALKLAQDTPRRGSLIHGLVGLACEGMALKEIRGLASSGEADDAALEQAGERLAALHASRVPITDVLLWEWFYVRRSLPDLAADPQKYSGQGVPMGETYVALARRNLEDYFRRLIARCEQPYHEVAGEPVQVPDDPLSQIVAPAIEGAHTRSVALDVEFTATMTMFALERYRLANDQYPDMLEQLVPDFLKAVPTDLFDGLPLKYLRERGSYVLYSVGEDMTDDGGVPPPVPGLAREPFHDLVFHPL